MKPLSEKRWLATNLALIIATAFVLGLALLFGGRFLSPFQPLTPEEQDILWVSRLPRVLLAAIAGMALGASGNAFQGLLQNSLADPYILGVSSGAALGSILALAFGVPFHVVPVIAFASAFVTMLLVFRIASRQGQITPHTLLLTGVILNAFLFAFILILHSLAGFDQAQKILFLLIGNLEPEALWKLGLVFAFVLTGLVFLTYEGRALNLLSTGSEAAYALGLDVDRHRKRIFLAASLMVGAVVPLAGLIGFIGLFVPHIARILLGPDHRLSVPASAWIGAILLVACDTVARTVLVDTRFQTELPVGAVTALLGAPFFLFLLKKGRR